MLVSLTSHRLASKGIHRASCEYPCRTHGDLNERERRTERKGTETK